MDLEQELERIATARMQQVQEQAQAPVTEEPVAPPAETESTAGLEERAKDHIGAVATLRAIQDQAVVDEITDKKKEELRQSATAHLIQERAESKSAEIRLQEANYGVYAGVASYAGIKKPLPQYMQKIIFVFLSILQCICLIFLGSFTSVINIIAEQIDSVVKRLSSIAKSAKILVLSLLGLAFIGLVAYVIVTLLKRYNIV